MRTPAETAQTLLRMQADPVQEKQRITEHYRRLSDDELLNLAGEFRNLTDTAQEALRARWLPPIN